MIAALGLKLMNSLRRFMVDVKCPKCGHVFKPGAEREFASWAEFAAQSPCPKCGFRCGVGSDADWWKHNPPGPFGKPHGSKIEEQQVSDRQLIFFLPRSGNWGGLLPFTIIWNLGVVPLFIWTVALGNWPVRGPQIFISIFFAVGMALIYSALGLRFATHLLYLGPDIVRVQRRLLWRKNHDLPTAAIESVRRVEAYSQVTGDDEAYRITTYCIELRAGLKAVRLGTTLAIEEQHWLAWRIRDFVRRHGGTKLGDEPPKIGGRP